MTARRGHGKIPVVPNFPERVRPKPLGGTRGAREAARRIAATLDPVMIRMWRRYRDREALDHEDDVLILQDYKAEIVGNLCSMQQLAEAICEACPTGTELDLVLENEALRERLAKLEQLLSLQP